MSGPLGFQLEQKGLFKKFFSIIPLASSGNNDHRGVYGCSLQYKVTVNTWKTILMSFYPAALKIRELSQREIIQMSVNR